MHLFTPRTLRHLWVITREPSEVYGLLQTLLPQLETVSISSPAPVDHGGIHTSSHTHSLIPHTLRTYVNHHHPPFVPLQSLSSSPCLSSLSITVPRDYVHPTTFVFPNVETLYLECLLPRDILYVISLLGAMPDGVLKQFGLRAPPLLQYHIALPLFTRLSSKFNLTSFVFDESATHPDNPYSVCDWQELQPLLAIRTLQVVRLCAFTPHDYAGFASAIATAWPSLVSLALLPSWKSKPSYFFSIQDLQVLANGCPRLTGLDVPFFSPYRSFLELPSFCTPLGRSPLHFNPMSKRLLSRNALIAVYCLLRVFGNVFTGCWEQNGVTLDRYSCAFLKLSQFRVLQPPFDHTAIPPSVVAAFDEFVFLSHPI